MNVNEVTPIRDWTRTLNSAAPIREGLDRILTELHL
jgi:hypothetical protein